MSAALKWNQISVEEYLAGEFDSPPWFEYLGGLLFRRPDERNVHNMISGNIFGSLAVGLRGRLFRPWSSATKIRIEFFGGIRFYHPDASVIGIHSFQDEPTAVFEVLSRKTRRVDGVEKKGAYLTIPSLRLYVLVEQDSPLVVVFRRTDAGFVREVYEGLDAVVRLGEIEIELPLAEVYDGVEFVAELDDEAER